MAIRFESRLVYGPLSPLGVDSVVRMKARDFPSYRLRHAIRVWRARRYQSRNPLYYPPEDSVPSSEGDVVQIPPSESLERSNTDD